MHKALGSIPSTAKKQNPTHSYERYKFLTYLSCGKMRSCSELYNSWRTLERNWPHHLSPPHSWTSRRPVCNRIFGVPLMHKCLKSSSQAWAWNVLCKTAGTECPITRKKTWKFPISTYDVYYQHWHMCMCFLFYQQAVSN
jgi:hypothetical protein